MNDGEVLLDRNLLLSPNLTRRQFFTMKNEVKFELHTDNDPYISYRIHGRSYHDIPCVALVYFVGEKLKEVQLFMEWREISQQGRWGLNSLKLEEQRHEYNEQLLTNLLGSPPYRYKWGSIVATLDKKDGIALIIFRYG